MGNKLSPEEALFMSNLKSVRTYSRKKELAKEIIKGVALGGFVAACMVGPGLAQGAKMFPELIGRENAKRRQNIYRLLKAGYIDTLDNKPFLTNKGWLYFHRIQIEEFKINKDKSKWNKKWYVTTFDIPESHRYSRSHFRTKLLSLGFEFIQKSVFIHPYDHLQEINLLAKMFNVDVDLLHMEVTKISSEKKLKRIFKSIIK